MGNISIRVRHTEHFAMSSKVNAGPVEYNDMPPREDTTKVRMRCIIRRVGTRSTYVEKGRALK